MIPARPGLDRRRFLRGIAGVAVGMAAGRAAIAQTGTRRTIALVHTHTGESLSAMYYDGAAYVPAALQQLNHLLRDFRTETVYPIDPGVLDQLFRLQSLAGSNEAFQVICGYRSATTNEALRRASSGVAEHSLHLQGRAIDVRLPGVDTARLALLARDQQVGGVGYYRISDFVHVDTGRVRTWGDPLAI
ncbi:MAG: DUF882 domain-containing protein [Proteobacteria bacterium]|nr:DUF882 domain-containing protein [Pseudomonadota bacterium]